SLKSGGGHARMALADDHLPLITSPCDQVDDLLALNDALERLAAIHPDKAELIKLLYFGGLTLEETADLLGTSKSSVHRQWQFARAWLLEAMAAAAGSVGKSGG